MMKINWSYYYDEIKDRIFYIIGFIILISLQWIDDWYLIGPIMGDAQAVGILPSRPNLFLLLQNAAILVIFVVSWDLLAGYSGQFSFGHALFLGMGGYLSALIKMGLTVGDNEIFPGLDTNVKEIFGIYIDISVLQAIFLASFIISIFAVIVGILIQRMKGSYFALVTLVLPLIFQLMISTVLKDYTGGEGGLSIRSGGELIHTPNTDLVGVELYRYKIEQLYYVTFAVMLISIAIMYLLARSRYGLVLKSIREDELAASSIGINVNAYKVSTFAISSFFASIAGGLFIQTIGFASSALFEAERSFEIIIFAIFGGIGTIIGGIIGTYFLVFVTMYYINQGFVDIPTIEVLALAILLILVLRYQPRGLINSDKQLRNALFFGAFFTLLLAFYDTGLMLSNIPSNLNPATWLQDWFGENERGLLGIDVFQIQGRMFLYFIFGTLIGYFGPELFQKIRLKLWGVWPNLGDFEPPT